MERRPGRILAGVPYAWVEQMRPGGLVVFPWMPGWEAGHRVRLTVTGDGGAVGRFHGGSVFMVLRAQRPHVPSVSGEPCGRSFADGGPARVSRPVGGVA